MKAQEIALNCINLRIDSITLNKSEYKENY